MTVPVLFGVLAHNNPFYFFLLSKMDRTHIANFADLIAKRAMQRKCYTVENLVE